MAIIFQPKGTGTELKNGTIVVKAPEGAQAAPTNSGWAGVNYTIDTYVTNLPTTGTIDAKYSPRFTGCDICN